MPRMRILPARYRQSAQNGMAFLSALAAYQRASRAFAWRAACCHLVAQSAALRRAPRLTPSVKISGKIEIISMTSAAAAAKIIERWHQYGNNLAKIMAAK